MKLRTHARRLTRVVRTTLFPEPEQVDDAAAAADAKAEGWWEEVFKPLGGEVLDADVLEFGCRDGRLLRRLLHDGARSVTGLEETPLWDGAGSGTAWDWTVLSPALRLMAGMDQLSALDTGTFDLIICRGLDGQTSVSRLETTLARLYALLRPGGEMLVRVRCADGQTTGGEGPGYGFMTPTSWALTLRSAGFEIDQVRRVWGENDRQSRIAAMLPQASEDERLCAELHYRLIRPWELGELEALTARRRKRR